MKVTCIFNSLKESQQQLILAGEGIFYYLLLHRKYLPEQDRLFSQDIGACNFKLTFFQHVCICKQF